MEKVLSEVKNIYLVGIGGMGMSGLAFLLKDRGFFVQGSDCNYSRNVELLRQEGIDVFIGHCPGRIGENIDLVAYSSAIAENNSEIAAAKKYNIAVIGRGELLGYICRDQKSVVISGSHGKTTTTFLLNHILRRLGYSPAFFAGGLSLDSSRNAIWGDDYFIIESDESDASFLYFNPWVSFITNIDYEHLSCYGNIDNLENNFLKFARQTRQSVFGCGDDFRVRRILDKVAGVSFGFGPENRFQARNLNFDAGFSYFDFCEKDTALIRVKIPLLGKHNILNSLGVLSFLFYFNHDLERGVEAMNDFRPPQRRFQNRGFFRGVNFIDDYAHHPTEIAAALAAARQLNPGRIFVIFQPHRFSRMKDLYDKFLACFGDADEIIVTDIYSASEVCTEELDMVHFSRALAKKSGKKVSFVAKPDLLSQVPPCLSPGDLCLALGAGDINLILTQIVDKFKDSD